jgi:hypothetical protein
MTSFDKYLASQLHNPEVRAGYEEAKAETPPFERPSRPVMKGMALLDEKRPGWWKGVDLMEFDLGSSELCIIAYAFPECQYYDAVEDLSGISLDIDLEIKEAEARYEEIREWEREYGFVGDRLTEQVWRNMIRFRQMHPEMAVR